MSPAMNSENSCILSTYGEVFVW